MELRHPFKIIRHDAQLSQAAVAKLSGVTPQVVMRTEQGLYGTPSVKLTSYLSNLEECPYTSAELEQFYREWQSQHRVYHKVKIEQPILTQRAQFPHRVLSFPQFRGVFGGTTSLVGLCKLLCIHPSQVDRYTRRGGNLFFLEEALRDVCTEEVVQWVTAHLRKS